MEYYQTQLNRFTKFLDDMVIQYDRTKDLTKQIEILDLIVKLNEQVKYYRFRLNLESDRNNKTTVLTNSIITHNTNASKNEDNWEEVDFN